MKQETNHDAVLLAAMRATSASIVVEITKTPAGELQPTVRLVTEAFMGMFLAEVAVTNFTPNVRISIPAQRLRDEIIAHSPQEDWDSFFSWVVSMYSVTTGDTGKTINLWGFEYSCNVTVTSSGGRQFRTFTFNEQVRSARASERERLTSVLHDNILQELFALSLGFGAFLPLGAEDEEVEIPTQTLIETMERLEAIGQDIRATLSSSEIEDHTRLPDIEKMVAYWNSATDIEISVRVEESAKQCPFENAVTKTILVNIVREAISNAIKHSAGTTVEVRLSYSGTYYRVSICDNGIGLPPGELEWESGIYNMKAAAARVGGDVTISSDEFGIQGTTVQAVFPESSLN